MGGLRNCSLGLNIRKLARANDGSWLCYAGYLLRLNCERIFTDVAIPSESWIGCRELVVGAYNLSQKSQKSQTSSGSVGAFPAEMD